MFILFISQNRALCQKIDSINIKNPALEQLGVEIIGGEIIREEIIQSVLGNLIGDSTYPPDTFMIVKNLTIKVCYPFCGPIREIKNYDNVGIALLGYGHNHQNHKTYQPKISEWKKINDTLAVITLKNNFPIMKHSELSITFFAFPIIEKTTNPKNINNRWIFTKEKTIDFKNPRQKTLVIKIENQINIKSSNMEKQ